MNQEDKNDKKEKKKITLKEIGVGKLLILLAAGVALIMFSLPSGSSNNNEETTIAAADAAAGVNSSDQTYEEQMESKLQSLLSSVSGVGETEVMITFKSSKESILQTDSEYSQDLTDETDSAGGVRKQESSQGSSDTVLTNGSSPYVVKEVMPEIEGVVIICDGGDKASVKSEITEAVQALFGIEAHKIKVLKRMDGNS